MIEVYNNLYIGSSNDCNNAKNMAILHACKSCHKNILGYSISLSKEHENYLIYKPNEDNIYLNLVDMDKELLPKHTDIIMKEAISFINKHILNKPVLVHCDMGMSRSGSIGLLYLAINNIISNDSYMSAAKDFKKLYSPFSSGYGIAMYMENNWQKLISINPIK